MKHNKLKGLMKTNGFTQEQLAKEIGIAESSLNKKLNGKEKFRSDEIIAIASLFDIFGHIEEYFFCSDTCEIHADKD